MLLLDGLSANGPVMQRCRHYHWQFMSVLKDQDLATVWEEFHALHALQSNCFRHLTILWVTHDIEDAIAISDNVVVLSSKPTTVKAQVAIDLGSATKDPVEVRKTMGLRDYFVRIVDELKYLDHGDGY